MKAAIDAGKIGAPALGVFQMYSWRDLAYYRSDPWRGRWDTEGGGVLVNQSPHQLDFFRWFMGDVAEVSGEFANLNHPGVEVEDTAVATLRFANGGLGSIVTSVSQRPGLYTKVHVHGTSGASVGVETDRGATFIAGVSGIAEPPLNDVWTVPGEEGLLAEFQSEDRARFAAVDATSHYHALQIRDFLVSVIEARPPLVTGEDGRAVVAMFTAIYQSARERRPIRLQGWQPPTGVLTGRPPPRVDHGIPAEEDVPRVEAEAEGRGRVVDDRVAEPGEQAGLRAGLAGRHEVAPAGGERGARLGIPDHEVAEDADGGAGVVRTAAPSERDPHLVLVVGRQAGVGERVAAIPDRELIEHLVAIRRVDLHDLNIGVGKVEPAREPVPLLAVQANQTSLIRRVAPITPCVGKLDSFVSQSLPSGAVEVSVPFGQLFTPTSRHEYEVEFSFQLKTVRVLLFLLPAQ